MVDKIQIKLVLIAQYQELKLTLYLLLYKKNGFKYDNNYEYPF